MVKTFPPSHNNLGVKIKMCLNLRRKYVSCPLTCVYCYVDIEHEWHLFVTCDNAESLWIEAGLWNLIMQNRENTETLNSFIFRLMQDSSQATRSKIGVVLWCIWKKKNVPPWATVFSLAMQYFSEWSQVQASSIFTSDQC